MDGGTLSDGLGGGGPQADTPTYTFCRPLELKLEFNASGVFQAEGEFALAEGSVLGEKGRVVVYGTRDDTADVLHHEDGGSSTIRFTWTGYEGDEGFYFDNDGETKVLAVLDGKDDASHSVGVLCQLVHATSAKNGVYTGELDLYVEYTEDEVKAGQVVTNKDLEELERHTVKVTLDNTVGYGIVSQPQDASVSEGESAVFSVAVTGGGTITYQWQQSADGGATWTDIPGATGETYTAETVTTAMDGRLFHCVVSGEDGWKLTSESAGLSVAERAVCRLAASPASLDFGSAYPGYASPAAQTVTVTNTGNRSVALVQPVSEAFEIGGLSATELAPGGAATLTVSPKTGLGVGAYAESLAITGTGGAAARVTLTFTVRSRPYIPPTPSGPDWDDVARDIADAEAGDRIVVDMDGETVLPGEVLEELAGRGVTLVLEMDGNLAWEIDGADVPEGAAHADLDMGVELGEGGIAVDVVDLVSGESGTVQVALAHDGPFGFSLTLVAPLGKDAAGLFANLYRYDEDAATLRFEAAGIVDEDGCARVQLDHASSWLIALDSRLHALPFTDAEEGRWYSESVRWAWLYGVMCGYEGSDAFGVSDPLTRELQPSRACTRAEMAGLMMGLAARSGK